MKLSEYKNYIINKYGVKRWEELEGDQSVNRDV